MYDTMTVFLLGLHHVHLCIMRILFFFALQISCKKKVSVLIMHIDNWTKSASVVYTLNANRIYIFQSLELCLLC